MTQGNDLAYPTFDQNGICPSYSEGLSKREYFAAMFTAAQIQGIVAGSGNTAHGWSDSDFAAVGVSIADALINALNQPLK